MFVNVPKRPENRGFSVVVASAAIRSNLLQLTVCDGTFDGIKYEAEAMLCSPI
jgi:hypothetical protein